jgi:flagellar basal-body rod protein FlgG
MKALYTAASGMNAQTTRLDNIANNISNVNTTGYKRSTATFSDLFYEEMAVSSEGDASGSAQVGGGVQLTGVVRDHSGGSMVYSGNPLHAAISGDGFFEVTNEAGETFYTRDGTFQKDANGDLATASGHKVGVNLGDYNNYDIKTDGSVIAMDETGAEINLGNITVTAFANPSSLEAMGGNLYRANESAGSPTQVELGQNGNELRGGHTEGSNVDVARELIEMIQAQRAYELTSKVIQAADETLQTAVNLRR